MTPQDTKFPHLNTIEDPEVYEKIWGLVQNNPNVNRVITDVLEQFRTITGLSDVTQIAHIVRLEQEKISSYMDSISKQVEPCIQEFLVDDPQTKERALNSKYDYNEYGDNNLGNVIDEKEVMGFLRKTIKCLISIDPQIKNIEDIIGKYPKGVFYEKETELKQLREFLELPLSSILIGLISKEIGNRDEYMNFLASIQEGTFSDDAFSDIKISVQEYKKAKKDIRDLPLYFDIVILQEFPEQNKKHIDQKLEELEASIQEVGEGHPEYINLGEKLETYKKFFTQLEAKFTAYLKETQEFDIQRLIDIQTIDQLLELSDTIRRTFKKRYQYGNYLGLDPGDPSYNTIVSIINTLNSKSFDDIKKIDFTLFPHIKTLIETYISPPKIRIVPKKRKAQKNTGISLLRCLIGEYDTEIVFTREEIERKLNGKIKETTLVVYISNLLMEGRIKKVDGGYVRTDKFPGNTPSSPI